VGQVANLQADCQSAFASEARACLRPGLALIYLRERIWGIVHLAFRKQLKTSGNPVWREHRPGTVYRNEAILIAP
jgi:hypothetical protein